MKRRSGAGRQPPRPHKAASPKRRNAKNVMRNRGASVVGQGPVVARLTHERDEALLRETANSEILRLISNSPGELETVFHAILENATRVCAANFGILQLAEGEAARIAAMHNVPAAMVEHRKHRPLLHASRKSAIGRAIATRRLVHIPDYAADAAYSTRDPSAVNLVELAGARSLLTVPMLRDDELIGIVSIYR